MSEVLTKTKFVSWCHLSPITIEVPHIPFKSEYFKSALVGFDDYSLKDSITWFGARDYGLVDVSGVLPQETEARIRKGHACSHIKVDMMTFLQSLDWIYTGNYATKFDFTRIIGYTTTQEAPVVAKPTASGFALDSHPAGQPWPEGTLCLFWPAQL